jgi:hypothetical protein
MPLLGGDVSNYPDMSGNAAARSSSGEIDDNIVAGYCLGERFAIEEILFYRLCPDSSDNCFVMAQSSGQATKQPNATAEDRY